MQLDASFYTQTKEASRSYKFSRGPAKSAERIPRQRVNAITVVACPQPSKLCIPGENFAYLKACMQQTQPAQLKALYARNTPGGRHPAIAK